MSLSHKTLKSVGLLLLVGTLAIFVSGLLSQNVSYPELREVSGTMWSFDAYATYFESLAEEKGGGYAFEVLKQAELAPNTDLHLLGHVVGDVLYKQKGIDGMHVCTQDFRNACSHSIVVGLFTERGVDALRDIADACRNAPGGSGAYTMCFHGLGHGVLAYTLYDFEKAIPLCEKTGTELYGNREAIECIGGMVMELVGGGQHDVRAWEKSREVYLSDSDPLYPCNAAFIPENARAICYTYLTPHLLQFAGGDLGNPTETDFKNAFDYCATLSNDFQNRDACVGGLGKEFVVLAHNRDIRNIGSMTTNEIIQTHEWCSLAGETPDQHSCRLTALRSLFWGGENDPNASFLFCENAPFSFQTKCYAELTTLVAQYLKGDRGETLCRRLPIANQNFCLAEL